MADDFQAEEQIADHAANDGQLLVVFLAEDGGMGTDDVEELGHHGADAAKMAGSLRAAESARKLGFVHESRIARRIHLVRTRRENRIRAMRSANFQIGLHGARVFGQVFVRTELRWVNENADHDGAALAGVRACRIDQRSMAGVQRTHRRDEENG